MMHALQIAGAALALLLLPGAIVFRLPAGAREKRAALAADERVFWYVLLSVGWSVTGTLALAAVSAYHLDRLVALNVGASAAALLAFRGRLRLGPAATRPGPSTLLALTLVGLCVWRFFPASEYVIGGKDPGVYINEGINIDRTGTLFRHDAVVASVPEAARDLFFPPHRVSEYYGLRFMGVFLNDPSTGEVIPGFPHLFPASIALGHGLAGIRGATSVVSVWALLGVLAVYFFGARLIGRWAAFLACGLLILNVAETWYARYPNAEVVMQTLVFASLLAFARSTQDDDPYFAGIAGAMCVLLVFLRFDVFLAVAGLLSAAALTWIIKRRAPSPWFVVPLVAGACLALLYFSQPMRAYFFIYKVNLPSPWIAAALIVAGVLAVVALGMLRKTLAPLLTKYVPWILAITVVALAAYALFLRQPDPIGTGGLRDSDAFALRTFRVAYVFWPALVAGIAGYVIVGRREFWRDPAFFIVFATFCIFFFRKLNIVQEHFWMARRFVPVILPGLFLLAAGAAVGSAGSKQTHALSRRLAGTLLITFIGWQYAVAAAPVAAHVEYRGAIHAIEQIAARVTDRDLVLFEGRNASDVHVLAVPLAYAHGKNVLVVDSPVPDRRTFESFLTGALERYDRVLMLASGGTDVLTQRIVAEPIAAGTVILPEYATAPWDQYPSGPRLKDLSYDLFQLRLGNPERRGFALDVGTLDDLSVVRFHARELTEGRTVRWTGPQSFVAATGLAGTERELMLVMHDGGRPAGAAEATVEVFFNESPLGTIHVGSGFKEYRLALPPDVVALAAQSNDPAQLRLRSSTWRPRDFIGGTDDRELGVMVDRVEIH